MSINIFPIIQPSTADKQKVPKLFKEVKWDYNNNKPLIKNGSPVIVYGKEAVLVWAWKALHTPRFKHEIFTWNYGCDAESLIGQPFTEALKQSEAARYVKECLLINPYITGVTNITVAFEDESLQISCAIKTVYGEEKIDV